jgi:uroporphyrinogen decarboxylase
MNSRKRFAYAISHQTPDKVPLDLGGHQTGIHLLTYQRVLERLGLEDPHLQIYDYNQQLALPCEALLTRFQIDTRTVYLPGQILPAAKDLDTERYGEYIGYYNNFGIFYGRKANAPRIFYNDIFHPFAEFTSASQVRNYDWPKVNSSLFVGLRDYARTLYENTEYALIGRSMGSIFQWAHFLFGLKNFMKRMLRDQDIIKAALEGLLEYCTEFATLYLKEVGDMITTVQYTSDLTDQQGPLINPILYRKIVKPIHAEFFHRLKSLPRGPNRTHPSDPIKINMHCCGAAHEFLPDLIDIGLDAINPVQINAAGMEPCGLKSKFGPKIVFWGGLCNSQKTLPFGTPKEIEREVQSNLACLKSNGGYVAASIHNICSDVPAENVIAMFDAAIKHRHY